MGVSLIRRQKNRARDAAPPRDAALGISYEKGIKLKISGNEVDYAA